MIKTKISGERKELLRWNKKSFFTICKGLSIKQVTQYLLEGESPNLSNNLFSIKSNYGVILANIFSSCLGFWQISNSWAVNVSLEWVLIPKRFTYILLTVSSF